MALLKQVAEDYTRSFSALQENVKAQRERIKGFDKRQEDKKTQKFEVSFMAAFRQVTSSKSLSLTMMCNWKFSNLMLLI